MPASLEGKSIAVARNDGRVDIITIKRIEHFATVGTKDEADKIIKLLTPTDTPAPNAAKDAVASATSGTTATKPAGGRGVSRKKNATRKGARKAPHGSKPKRTRRAPQGTAEQMPEKEHVDMNKLSDMVEAAATA